IEYLNRNIISNEEFIMWDKDPLGKRPDGYWRRFPILETNKRNKNIFTVGLIGSIIAEDRDILMANEINIDIERKITDLKESIKNINIVFVMDGTKSMHPYFPAVRDAIQRSMDELELKNQSIPKNYKFGVIVYRDYTEGDRVLEKIELQEDIENVEKLLMRVEAGDINNTTHPEAMFHGLIMALRTLRWDPKQTNILILVGDAGNHRDERKEDTKQNVIKYLTEKTCHFITIQVNRQAHIAYTDFIEQNKQIAENTVKLLHERLLNEYSQIKGISFKSIETETLDPSAFGYIGGPFINEVYGRSTIDEPLPPNQLTGQIISYIEKTNLESEELIKVLEGYIHGGNFIKPDTLRNNESPYRVDRLGMAILLKLKQIGLSDEQIDYLQRRRIQLFDRAHATMYVKEMNYPLFKKVLLLSGPELNDIIAYLNQFIVTTDPREDLQNAWRAILRNYAGNLSMEQLEKTPLDDLYEMVVGLPMKSVLLGEIRPIDIPNPKVFPDNLLRKYFEYIQEKIPELKKIANMAANTYPYAFLSNGVYYYWIDEDLLP
ncbi:VWA domain-containing protein, partial [candidate division KSB1 bacterium]